MVKKMSTDSEYQIFGLILGQKAKERRELEINKAEDYLESLKTESSDFSIAVRGASRYVYSLNWNAHCRELPLDHADALQREFIDVFYREMLSMHDEMMKNLRDDELP